MRRLPSLWLTLALAACGAPKASGPAWPAPAETDEDGGESIAPRPSSSVATAIEKSEEPEPDKKKADSEPEKKAEDKAEDTPAETPAAETQPTGDEEIITSEEIVIEIEDDD